MKPDEIETPEEFGAELLRLRNLSGLTREQLAEEAESLGTPISTATISTICGGSSIPRPYYLRIFLNALGVEDPAEHEAWQFARERVWAHKRGVPLVDLDLPADLRLRRIEESLAGLREQAARMEGMLLALAREWGIQKRDV